MKLNKEWTTFNHQPYYPMGNPYYKWDNRFLWLAKNIATWSKDPSTQVGCVLVKEDTHDVIGLGYNGFPRKIPDDSARLGDRDIKYDIILHAEENAMFNAKNKEWDTAYVYPFFPCIKCASRMTQYGDNLKTIVTFSEWPERWDKSITDAMKLFREAGISWRIYDDESFYDSRKFKSGQLGAEN